MTKKVTKVGLPKETTPLRRNKAQQNKRGIVLTLELPAKDASRLLRAANSGKLRHLGIISAKVTHS